MTITCRFCETPLSEVFADLGRTPLSNSYLSEAQLSQGETTYPLCAYVCQSCHLVQLGEFESPKAIFHDYAYFSSYSDSWLAHCQNYVEEISNTLGLNSQSNVVELASNDGYLLQYFVQKNIPVMGVEPAANVAAVAQKRGIPTTVDFFGAKLAEELKAEHVADLIIANNVLAHVPNVKDFVAGIAKLLRPEGMVTVEFPHLLQLMAENQFDTIYHEHFSYFSFAVVERIFNALGLKVVDVQELPTHGGSLRVYAVLENAKNFTQSPRVATMQEKEAQFGLNQLETYQAFNRSVQQTKRQLLSFLIEAKSAGKTIAGYGAPAKGNTLLNFCGIGTDFIDFTVDRNPVKQGTYLPGSQIPVYAVEALFEAKPDYILILPWNIQKEVIEKTASEVQKWGGQYVVPIPQIKVINPTNVELAV